MSNKDKVKLIIKNLEEVITEKDLQKYIDSGVKLKHYIGFEISGKMHLGTGLMAMYKVKDLMDAGVETSIFLADWHTWINDKLGGDTDVIRGIGTEYFKEGFKASMKVVGGDPSKLNFVTGFDLYHNNDKYWETVVDVSKNTSLARMKRSTDITGRKAGESIDFAKLIYPAMQVADIFSQGINIAHSGMDQRKAHVVARDVAFGIKSNPLLNKKGDKIKPVAIHHPLILGLGKPSKWPIDEKDTRDLWVDMKMSKSKPDTAVFITDSEDEIKRKINNSFCPEGEIKFNPALDWAKNLLFVRENYTLEIKRPEKWGGDKQYDNFESLEQDFSNKLLHPQDLKSAVSDSIAALLKPAREHFATPKNKLLKEKMDKILVTR
jgi:tyrosyl-tRNA synthetase